MVNIKHMDRPPHCVYPRPKSGFTREYVHGPLIPLDTDDDPARGVLYGIVLSIPIWAMGLWWVLS